jgi:dTDP-4-amino-4,6-dideoxygalactose transaminase
MVTTDDQILAEKVKRIRNHGRASSGPVDAVELGYNYRMSDIHAVIALSQLKHLREFTEARKKLASSYDGFLAKQDWIQPQLVRSGNSCPYYVYLTKIAQSSRITRDQLADRFAAKGIGTSVLYHPIHTQPFYRDTLRVKASCPVAEELGRDTLALPMYNGMTSRELDIIKENLHEASDVMMEQYA